MDRGIEPINNFIGMWYYVIGYESNRMFQCLFSYKPTEYFFGRADSKKNVEAWTRGGPGNIVVVTCGKVSLWFSPPGFWHVLLGQE
jgi:hypothetical protein